MSWSEYEKWSFSIIKDVLAHLQLLTCSILFGLKRKALEIGSGTGQQSCFISYFGIEVISIDCDKRVLKMASKVSHYYGAKDLTFVLADARFLPFKDKVFDVSFSQGLLEHLEKTTILEILSESRRVVSRKILFSVPSINYPEHDLGNERLLYPSEWSILLSKHKAKSKYYTFDLQAIKNSISTAKFHRPWHILIDVPSE